jgi:hypothetical protein
MNAATLIHKARYCLRAARMHISRGNCARARHCIKIARIHYAQAIQVKGAMRALAVYNCEKHQWRAAVWADETAEWFAYGRLYKHKRSAKRAAKQLAFNLRCKWL